MTQTKLEFSRAWEEAIDIRFLPTHLGITAVSSEGGLGLSQRRVQRCRATNCTEGKPDSPRSYPLCSGRGAWNRSPRIGIRSHLIIPHLAQGISATSSPGCSPLGGGTSCR
jgi:hypothetical protein